MKQVAVFYCTATADDFDLQNKVNSFLSRPNVSNPVLIQSLANYVYGNGCIGFKLIITVMYDLEEDKDAK